MSVLDTESLQLKIIGDQQFVDALEEEASSSSEFDIENTRPFEQTSEFFIDPIALASLAISIYGMAFEPIIPYIYRAIKKSKSKTIVIKSALGTIEFQLNENTTEQEFLTEFVKAYGLKDVKKNE